MLFSMTIMFSSASSVVASSNPKSSALSSNSSLPIIGSCSCRSSHPPSLPASNKLDKTWPKDYKKILNQWQIRINDINYTSETKIINFPYTCIDVWCVSISIEIFQKYGNALRQNFIWGRKFWRKQWTWLGLRSTSNYCKLVANKNKCKKDTIIEILNYKTDKNNQ